MVIKPCNAIHYNHSIPFFRCKTTNEIAQVGKPDSFIIVVQCYEQNTEVHLLTILNWMTTMQHFDLRQKNFFE